MKQKSGICEFCLEVLVILCFFLTAEQFVLIVITFVELSLSKSVMMTCFSVIHKREISDSLNISHALAHNFYLLMFSVGDYVFFFNTTQSCCNMIQKAHCCFISSLRKPIFENRVFRMLLSLCTDI